MVDKCQIRDGHRTYHTTQTLTYVSTCVANPAGTFPLPFFTEHGSTWPQQGPAEAAGAMGWGSSVHITCIYFIFQITQDVAPMR